MLFRSVETLEGTALSQPHWPHRLVARNSQGEVAEILALIKTQGSDTKLVGQMQPYWEAKTLHPQPLGGVRVPPLVSQISDGENGGVMMNEFPSAFMRSWYEIRDQGSQVVGLNGTEYLELALADGSDQKLWPACQARGQQQLWQQLGDRTGTVAVTEAISALQAADPHFAMQGGSWTSDRDWVRGYDNVMEPLERLSVQFHQTMDRQPRHQDGQPLERQFRYRNALLHNLLLQTSCFRYWGQGAWTDYAREIYQRGQAILTHDFS